jgi:uracil-DNA glycosylase
MLPAKQDRSSENQELVWALRTDSRRPALKSGDFPIPPIVRRIPAAQKTHYQGALLSERLTNTQRPMTTQLAPATSGQFRHWLTILNREVVTCTRCPRLVQYREEVARVKRRAYRDCDYWGKPVPGFGDQEARVLIMGLAPGAHGSNRTGRPFTGDASGNFMYPVLYETGFASQPTATDLNDGLKLKDLYITAAVRCAPPDNKPTPQELAECSQFLDREIAGLKRVKVIVALGKIGFDAYLNYLKRRAVAHPFDNLRAGSSAKNAEGWGTPFSKQAYPFKHAASYRLPDGKVLIASYHPSNQNTQTGKLTRKMFLDIFKEAARFADG